MAAEREQLLRLRRELDQGRNLVDQQIGRMNVVGRRVQEDSERLLDQARMYVDASSGSPQRGYARHYDSSPYSAPHSQPPPPPSAAQQYPVSSPSRRQRTPGYAAAAADYFTQSASEADVRIPPLRGFDMSVQALFEKYRVTLHKVFLFYASHAEGAPLVRMPGFVRLAQDYDICPTFTSRRELRECFDRAAHGSDALDFGLFVEALGHVALTALSKPMFSHMYSSSASKVNVLLAMWGVGDADKLDSLRSQRSYAQQQQQLHGR